ncbi:MAG: ribonuclease HII [Candidatus Paceibacterota bacterium]|jgi:ribonuclease HII
MKYLIGIDEVGRGPIAGPVAVGVFVFLKSGAVRFFKGVKESKQLSEAKREEWFAKILKIQKSGVVDFCVSFQSRKKIDLKGLSWAIKQAVKSSLNKVCVNSNISSNNCQVLLDGGLKAPAEFLNQKTIIKGDEKETVIALASICAKVLRDRRMIKLGQRYPQYGFEIHKGYGTGRHYGAIKKYGMLEEHRRSFLRGEASQSDR